MTDIVNMISKNVGEIQQYLLENNLKIHVEPGDGNCMFHCLARFLNDINNSNEYTDKIIRTNLVYCIRFHRNGKFCCIYNIMIHSLFNCFLLDFEPYFRMRDDAIKDIDNEDFDTYIERMGKDGEWGDYLMQIAFTKWYGYDIFVLDKRDERNCLTYGTLRKDNELF